MSIHMDIKKSAMDAMVQLADDRRFAAIVAFMRADLRDIGETLIDNPNERMAGKGQKVREFVNMADEAYAKVHPGEARR